MKILLGVTGALILMLALQTWRVGQAQAELASVKDNFTRLESAYENNLQVYKVCKDVNAFNARERDSAAFRANALESLLKTARAEYQQELERIEQEATHLEHDTECRTLSAPLPADFLRWVRE